MALDAAVKAQIVKDYQFAPGDTGSPEVQVALLTETIKQLTPHFEANKKDHHSRRGLQLMVNKRRSLLSYLMKRDPMRHQQLLKRLGLRRSKQQRKDEVSGSN